MTLQQFSEIFAVLAIQLRQTDADEATIRVYFKALQDIEPELLAMAAERLARTSEWFPKTSEWRDMACLIEREREATLRDQMRNSSVRLCAACEDTGWARDEQNRVSRCDCRNLRRLEVLGRRPWPTLPAAIGVDRTQESKALALVKPAVKVMP